MQLLILTPVELRSNGSIWMRIILLHILDAKGKGKGKGKRGFV